jgi:2-succinyl-5-enolpyruvyl-6-hydroxy-3-cyclohexene-1-carboxylate synthase
MNSTKLARNLVRQLIELGVSDIVISPGSRNAPLLIALNTAEKLQLIDLHSRLDERGAAYFALGVSKASQSYVAAVCTSGTAAANYLPALLEAYHSGAKLLLITADRPERLRRTGANQTTIQPGMYSVIKSHDISSIVDLHKLLKSGPVHLNVQFDEPLIEDEDDKWLDGIKIENEVVLSIPQGKLEVSTGVVVIGHDRGGFTVEEVNNFCKKLNWPVIAEDPISFPNSISHAALFLQDEKIAQNLKPEWSVVIGRTTLSRPINKFVNSAKFQAYFDQNNSNNLRTADFKANLLPEQIIQNQNYDSSKWQLVKSIAKNSLNQAIGEKLWSEQLAIKEIVKKLPADSALFLGASRPTRDVEAIVNESERIEVFANRGLSGIDGNISTIFGIAQEFENTFAIVGDLTFLHDLSALVNPVKSNIRIFVIDNNGGGIFSMLPVSTTTDFEKLFATPHNLDLAKLLAGFKIKCSEINNLTQLNDVLHSNLSGLEIVLLRMPSRAENAEFVKGLTQSVSKAVRIGLNLA